MFHFDLGSLAAGIFTSSFVIAIAFKIAGAKLPGVVVGALHKMIVAIGASEWVRNPARPARARWWRATLELFEAEIPEPGSGHSFYLDLATAWVGFLREHLPVWLAFMIQTSDRWAGLLEPVGDAIDTELDADVAAIAAAPAEPAALPAPAPAAPPPPTA